MHTRTSGRAWTWALAAAAAAALAGCGGVGGEAEGSVAGHSLDVKDAVFMSVRIGPESDVQLVVLSDQEDTCGTLHNVMQSAVPNATLFTLELVRQDDAGLLHAGPGEYRGAPVSGDVDALRGALALGTFERTDALCRRTVPLADAETAGGKARLESVRAGPGGHAEGTFDLTFGPQGADRLRGSFRAGWCELPVAAMLTGSALNLADKLPCG